MPNLKFLFGGNLKSQEETKMASRNRTPGVVARLMGLEVLPAEPSTTKKENAVLLEKRVPDSNTLVDITGSGKRLNGGVTRSQKSRSFDEAFDKQHKDVSEVRAVQPGAECLQSIQLEELNRQLLARHMKVLDELNEAKQQLALKKTKMDKQNEQEPRKGLSDSSEFLDAVDLLQANRPFFEKYFQKYGAEAVSRRHEPAAAKQDIKWENKLPRAKIPRFLSGQSSPRPPPPKRLDEQSSDDTASGRFLENKAISQAEKHGVSSIVVLKPRKKSDQQECATKQEKQTVKDRKDIAKLIAKKIKESISKEVARTFYSKVDTASPQRSPSRSFEKSDDTPRSRHSRSLSQPESPSFGDLDSSTGSDTRRKKLDSSSPRIKAGSPAKEHTKNGYSKSKEDRDTLKKAGAKTQKPLPEKNSGSRTSSPRNSNRQKELNSPDASPRVPSPRSAGALDNSPRPPKQKTISLKPLRPRETSGKSDGTSLEKKSKVKSAKVKPEVEDFTKSLDDIWLELQNGRRQSVQHQLSAAIPDDDCITITPTKDNKDSSNLTSTQDLKTFSDSTSPVSVLDLIHEEHDGRRQNVSSVEPASASTASEILEPRETNTINNEVKTFECRSRELVCPPDRQEDFIYLKKLVAGASTIQKKLAKLDSFVFEKLEDEYSHHSIQDSVIDVVSAQSRAINRWLIFDFANELLSKRMAASCDEQQLLQELWNSISQKHSLQQSGESLEALIKDELHREKRSDWIGNESGLRDLCQHLEVTFFNELVDEAITDLL